MSGADSGADHDARPAWRWDVALSFAGAQRGYVEEVAGALKRRGARCFSDAGEEIELRGRYLAEELPGHLRAAGGGGVRVRRVCRGTGPGSSAGRRGPGPCGNGESMCCPPGSMTRRFPGCCQTWSRWTCAAGARSSSPLWSPASWPLLPLPRRRCQPTRKILHGTLRRRGASPRSEAPGGPGRGCGHRAMPGRARQTG